MGKESKNKLKGSLSKYIKVPIYFNILWIIVAIIALSIDVKVGALITAMEIIYIVASLIVYVKFKPNIMKTLVEFGAEYSQVQRQMLHEMEVPYGLLEENGKILWTNEKMDELFNGKSVRNKIVSAVFDDFKPEYLEFDDEGKKEFQIKTEDKVFRVILREFKMNKKNEDSSLAQ